MHQNKKPHTDSYQQEFEQLFTQHFPSLFTHGFHLSADRDLTKDMIQSLFLELWEKRPPINSVAHWNAYLKKSLHRKIVKELQRKQQIIHPSDLNQLHLSEPSYEELLINFQKVSIRQQKVEIALQDLPVIEKEMLEARFKEGKSYAEIAEQTGKSKQTVYNQVYTAIKKLRKTFF